MKGSTYHQCPPWCHHCPDMAGDVMPRCYGAINSETLEGCSCPVRGCSFCGTVDANVWPCSWPEDRLVSITHLELEVGDLVETQQAKRVLRVLAVNRFTAETVFGKSLVTMYALRFPDDRYFLYYNFRSRIRAMRKGPCGSLCCDAHRREVADDVVYCPDHWRAWERVA